jgi:hypothetical protein
VANEVVVIGKQLAARMGPECVQALHRVCSAVRAAGASSVKIAELRCEGEATCLVAFVRWRIPGGTRRREVWGLAATGQPLEVQVRVLVKQLADCHD